MQQKRNQSQQTGSVLVVIAVSFNRGFYLSQSSDFFFLYISSVENVFQ